MTGKLPLSGSSLLAAGIVLAAAAWMLSGDHGAANRQSDGPAAVEERPPVVQTRWSVAEPMTSELVLTGRTAADRSVQVRAETAGVIATVLVARGAAVAGGEPILRFAEDERRARLLEAQSALAAARIRHEASSKLKAQGYQAVIELGQAKAALNAAEAAVELAQLELDRVVVRAPFDGVINERFVEVGDFVDRGQALAQLVDLDPIRVVAQASEHYLGQIRAGVQGTMRTLDGQSHPGLISYVGRVANPTTRTIPVELQADNSDGRLIEGITAELAVPVDQVFAHRVPTSVLSLADDGTLGVKAVDAQGIAVFHPVRILGDSERGLWVGNLPERLRLITTGQAFVQAGQGVTVVEPAAEEQP